MSGGKVVLIGWELGGGMGHINRLLPVARVLGAQGNRIAFAFRTLQETDRVFQEFADAPVFPVATWSPDPAMEEEMKAYSCNYADVLLRAGYGSAESLGALIEGWCEIFEMTQPSLVVCDHSPTAVLAAAGRIPVVHIGSGFATPPVGRPLLVLDTRFSQNSRERDAHVLKAVKEVQSGRQAPVPRAVSEILDSADNFSCCLPELDPYRRVRPKPAIGPVHGLPKSVPLGKSGSLFGYLSGQDRRVPGMLASLAKAGITCGIYVRELDPEWRKLVDGSAVTLYDKPQNLHEALAAASAVLHHGGLATSETALAMGRPQFLLSRNLEQALTADAIQTMGCGLNLSRQKGDVGELILPKMHAFDKGASTVAAKLASRPAVDVTGAIVDACVKHLSGAPVTS